MAKRRKDAKAATPLDVRSVTLEDLRRRVVSPNPLSAGLTAPSAANSLAALASPNASSSTTASPSGASIISAADMGRLVRTARQGMRLSQQQFADLAGVGRRFVSELENGKATLELGLVLQVCRAAGIDINAKRRQTR